MVCTIKRDVKNTYMVGFADYVRIMFKITINRKIVDIELCTAAFLEVLKNVSFEGDDFAP